MSSVTDYAQILRSRTMDMYQARLKLAPASLPNSHITPPITLSSNPTQHTTCPRTDRHIHMHSMASKFLNLINQSWRASIEPIYIERLCTSWILSPIVLCALRAFFSLYAFFVTFFILGWDNTHAATRASHQAAHSFSYFTDLTYWGLAFYFAFAAAHTASYARTGRPWLASWPGVLRWLHSAYYATITVYPFIVTGTGVQYKGFALRSADDLAQLCSGQFSPMARTGLS
jgi:hypothetical protein